ncbi:hypothetical protein N7476_005929 [Penicillium atrosanguineum]|uniref:NACHT-NTPase and P-loop NTPases N-terminal domain-containing protein n=1 Tax=Penicillium atrosanguineum TaxID=1132637 RepID=A0A9W9PZK3_9EURO|nr:hypothetical protein N7476_005929 [Penicillium atrosanguineum]
MAEAIGIMSGIITLIETSIKLYDSAQKDINISKTFVAVRRRLPIILDTLATCKENLGPREESIPEDVCEALEATLYACRSKARNLEEIFEKTVPGESDTREQRYSKIIRRLGKGNKVEELMLGLAEDVQLLINHDAVKSANQEQNVRLEDTINEMRSVISGTDNESFTVSFSSGGGAQTNYVQRGSGNQYVSSGGQQYNAETQNFVEVKHREDFDFRGPVGVCLGQVPCIGSDLFVGRGSELNEITKGLHPVHKLQKQRRLILGGIGGIGKTQLAIAYAYAESESGLYSSVFWLNAVSEAALNDSFRSIASLIFKVQDPRLLEGKEIIGRVHQWLSDSTNTRWLLIFDNYDDPSKFDLDAYCPLASHGSILITTRSPDGVAGRALHIKPIRDISDGLAILQTRSKRGNIQSSPHAKRLAERLAGFPLALATAGTYLQRTTLSVERYMQEYEKCWNIDPRRPTNLQEYRERTLYTTWDLSYARLEADDPEAAQLLRLLAYFSNQSLWYELFQDGLTKDSPKWLRELVAHEVSFQGVMGKLTEYCFIEIHFESGTWSMHNCVHDWTLAALNKNVDIGHYWYALDCVNATISGVDTDCFGRTNYFRSAGHAIRLLHQRFLENDMIYYPAPDKLDKVSRVSRLLQDLIQLAAADQVYMRSLARYERALSSDHDSIFDTVMYLGILYCNQSRLDEAEKMYMRVLAGCENALVPDHTSTLITVHSLGILYRDQCKLAEVENMYMRALAGCEKALGPDHSSTLMTVHNLGILYCNRGKLDEAEKMYMRALAGYEKALGPGHDSTLDTFQCLGILYRNQSKLDEAENIYMRALAGCEKALGPDHTSTSNTVHSLGILYSDQGKLDEAQKMFMRALAGYKKVLGSDHNLTLHTVQCLRVNRTRIQIAATSPDNPQRQYSTILYDSNADHSVS